MLGVHSTSTATGARPPAIADPVANNPIGVVETVRGLVETTRNTGYHVPDLPQRGQNGTRLLLVLPVGGPTGGVITENLAFAIHCMLRRAVKAASLLGHLFS
jgi:hypothetical protein